MKEEQATWIGSHSDWSGLEHVTKDDESWISNKVYEGDIGTDKRFTTNKFYHLLTNRIVTSIKSFIWKSMYQR